MILALADGSGCGNLVITLSSVEDFPLCLLDANPKSLSLVLMCR